jgi:hypothetical protein
MFRRKPPAYTPYWEKELHPSWRRYTRKYRKKKRIVRDLWILISLAMPGTSLAVTLSLALGATFLSLVILDETA